MCGIIGYLGGREAVDVLTEGLKRLEYRGYDSAGVAVLDGTGELHIRRCEGKLTNLTKLIEEQPCDGTQGIGHTRWATHGRPSVENAHPHRSGDTVVVHNGIIENYLQLKNEFGLGDEVYLSETDTEIIAHLVDYYVKQENDLAEGVRKALLRLQGSYAVVVLHSRFPGQMIAARNESPLVVGLGDGEFFVASDVPAFLAYTRKVVFLDDGEMAIFSADSVNYVTLTAGPLLKKTTEIHWSPIMAERAGYSHFMQKEIFEQPRAIIDTFRGRVNPETGEIYLEEGWPQPERLVKVDRVVIVACGTSYHAGLVGKFMIEELARIPVDVDLGSEFRYRDPIIQAGTLMIGISQSGETADTLAAVREGKRKGAYAVTICNAVGSTMVRESDGVIYTYAGPEIGVASTKSFTTQLTVLYLLAHVLARAKNRLPLEQIKMAIRELMHFPHLLEEVLGRDQNIKEIAKKYFQATDFLYLGRGINYPIALEGALKLKEISYIHAEGYPAGEMKHGPIALIDDSMPVLVLVTEGRSYAKILNNIEEVKARAGKVIAVSTVDNSDIQSLADDIIIIPPATELLSPILMTVPLQLLAYHVAVLRGTDVDQPRNLAKSVTVE
jgi:glucosamine--fructose-6-phosphate aminotransferase (isomerizing)